MSTAPTEWEPWTIVHKDTHQPVLPMDCTPLQRADCEALLVYRSFGAAQAGAEHQKEWEVDAEPMRLSDLIEAESLGQPPTEDGLGYHMKMEARNTIYKAQGIGIAGKIGEKP